MASPWYRSRGLRFGAAALSLAAVGGGAVLLALDNGCISRGGNPCGQRFDTAPAGLALVAGGAAVGVGALWLFLTSSSPPSGRGVAIGCGGSF